MPQTISSRRFSPVGGYPLFYVVNGHSPTCPGCAASGIYHPDEVSGPHVNWEDPRLHCEDCEERIESAYAERT